MQVTIINQLLVHDPKERPSADELLKSSSMPPPLLDDAPKFFQFLDFLLDSARKGCEYEDYHILMRRILDQKTPEARIFKWLDIEAFQKNLLKDSLIVALRFPTIHEIFFKRCQEIGATYCQVYTSNHYNLNIESLKINNLFFFSLLLYSRKCRSMEITNRSS